MATVIEQIFLYGEPDEEPMTGLMAVLAYSDLMLSGSVVFAMIVFASILAFNWEMIYPMAAWGANKLTLAIWAATSKVGWLLKQLLSIRSFGSLKSMLGKAEAVLVMAIAQSFLGHAMSGIGAFYFPYNDPLYTVIRLGATFIVYMFVDLFVFPYLFFDLTIICDALSEVVLDTKEYQLEMITEIPHFEIISGVTLCLLLVAPFLFFSETDFNGPVSHTPSSTSTATQTEGNKLQGATQPAAVPITAFPSASTSTTTSSSSSFLLQTSVDMRSAIKGYKAALAKERAAVRVAEKGNKRLSDEKEEFRQILIQKDRQLRVARNDLKNAAFEQDRKTQVLEDEVARLKDDLNAQVEESSRAQGKIAELEARFKQTETNQVFVSRAADGQDKMKEQILEAKRCASSGISEREAHLMEQLRLKTQVEQSLRSELDSVRDGMQCQIEVIRDGYRQEASEEMRRIQQIVCDSETEFRQLAHATIQDSAAKTHDLKEEIIRLQGELFVEQTENKDLEEKVKDLEGKVLKLQAENLDLELLASAEPAQPTTSNLGREPEEDLPLLARVGAPNPQDVGNELLRKSAEAVAAQQREEFDRRMKASEAVVKGLRAEVEDGQRQVRMVTADLVRTQEKAKKTIDGLEADLAETEAELKASKGQRASNQQAMDNGKIAELERQLVASREEAERNRQEAVHAIQHIRKLEAQMRSDDQKITQMKSPNRGSISTRLEQAQVTIVNQSNTISDLRKRIAMLEAGQ